MVRKLLVFVVVFLAVWELGWWAMGGVRPMLPWSLARYMSAPGAATVVDVRTPKEYRWLHVPGVRHVPELTALPADLPPQLANAPRDKPVVVVCMTGHRSSVVGFYLHSKGFKDVRSLTGGTLGWMLTANPVRRGP